MFKAQYNNITMQWSVRILIFTWLHMYLLSTMYQSNLAKLIFGNLQLTKFKFDRMYL